jgi:Domain of unknown function (DUF1707)
MERSIVGADVSSAELPVDLIDRSGYVTPRGRGYNEGEIMPVPAEMPIRLASEDVIINAPLSYAGSAQRIFRIRRRAPEGWQFVAITVFAFLLVILAWAFVTAWYLIWGLLLVPYRLLRRGARKRTAEALRHRELMGTIQGSAAASAQVIVAPAAGQPVGARMATPATSPSELVGDVDRDRVIAELREDMLAGRLSAGEFDERVGSAHAARTRADLDLARADLPLNPPS